MRDQYGEGGVLDLSRAAGSARACSRECAGRACPGSRPRIASLSGILDPDPASPNAGRCHPHERGTPNCCGTSPSHALLVVLGLQPGVCGRACPRKPTPHRIVERDPRPRPASPNGADATPTNAGLRIAVGLRPLTRCW